jgi:hypothetical protein
MTEVQFSLYPEGSGKPAGLYLNSLHSSKASMLSIFTPASDFKEFSVNEKTIVCVSLDDFSTAVKRVEKLKSDISIVSDQNNTLHIKVGGNQVKEFAISMLTPTEEEKEAKVTLDTKITVDAKQLHEQVKDLAAFAQQTTFEKTDSQFLIYGAGDRGEASVQTVLTDTTFVKKVEGPNSRTVYALIYISQMMKVFSEFDEVELEMATNKPIILRVHADNGWIKLTVAPRIER